MATPTGQIGLSDVNAELGNSPSALITMNDTPVRGLAGVGGSGTVISMNDLRGKSGSFTASFTIASNTNNYDIRSAAVSGGWDGVTDANITVTVNPGVYVSSTSTGSSAFTTGSPWPAGTTLTLVNNGVILGRGGNGGNGGANNSIPGVPGSPGGSGGPAFLAYRPVVVTNNGAIYGGGGGGGGGGTGFATNKQGQRTGAGGGGGGGIGNGSGGSGGSVQGAGAPGSPGSLTSAGGGGGGGGTHISGWGGGAGGSGGGYGSGGSNGSPGISPSYQGGGGGGGGAGAAVNGNPYITWPNSGTITGPIS